MVDIKTCGIVGFHGTIGNVIYKYFKDRMSTFGYSNSDRKHEKNVNNSDIIFICVPTPYHWNGRGYDDSIVDKVLSKIKNGKIVVIKSTIQIGSTNRFQKKYPNLIILFNPEFLSMTSAYNDFILPDRQIIGYTQKSYKVATEVLHLLPESPYDLICPAKEAELLKYINNLHGILEVIESNHYYDVCQKEGLNYDRVIKAAVSSKWVGCPMGRHYRNIYHKGFRGIGGKCFLKDLYGWIDYCKDKGINVDLFNVARRINKNLLASQGITEKLAEKINTEEDINKIKKVTKA